MGLRRRPISVLVLTQDQCGFCEQAQDLLQRLAREYELAIAEMDINTSEGQALALRGGILFPPGVFLDDIAFSYGRLSERKLRRELDWRVGMQSTAGIGGATRDWHVSSQKEG